MVTTISIDPVAFLNVRWYGIMYGLSLLVLVMWMLWQVRKGANLSYRNVLVATLLTMVFSSIISRLLLLAVRWDYYSQNPWLLITGEPPAIFVVLLSAALVIWVYSRVAKFHFGYFMDLAAPGIMLAQAVARVGCTINGCCHGIEAPDNLFWAIQYNSDYLYLVGPGYLDTPLYPTQPYEIVFSLIGFAVLVRLRGRLKHEGSLFLAYLALYSLWRVGIDFLRAGTPILIGLQYTQVVAMVLAAVAITLLIFRTHRLKAR